MGHEAASLSYKGRQHQLVGILNWLVCCLLCFMPFNATAFLDHLVPQRHEQTLTQPTDQQPFNCLQHIKQSLTTGVTI